MPVNISFYNFYTQNRHNLDFDRHFDVCGEALNMFRTGCMELFSLLQVVLKISSIADDFMVKCIKLFNKK